MNYVNKVGRNDPCPCGSGKKYKQCCLAPAREVAAVVPQGDKQWQRLRSAIGGLSDEMLKYVTKYLNPMVIICAWKDFMAGQDMPFDSKSVHMPIFLSYCLFDWRDIGEPESLTVGQAYLERYRRLLPALTVQYIEACLASPFSFFDVVTCEPDSGMTLRDILTGETVDVREVALSRCVQVGDVVFCKVVKLDQLAVVEMTGPVAIPPGQKSPILALRAVCQDHNQVVTAASIRENYPKVLATYYNLTEQVLNPPQLLLENTDGEPIKLHKLRFDISSPREAFDALSKLCLLESAEDLLVDAGYDEAGELNEIEFQWQKLGNNRHSTWDNTVLGYIHIVGNRLDIEVNSTKRAKTIRALVEDVLAGKVKHKKTSIESAEALMSKAKERLAEADSSQIATERDVPPEIVALTTEMMRAHYLAWVNEKVPALGRKTPMQAMKTPEGREMVEALVIEIERSAQRMQSPMDLSVMAELRVTLGLPPSTLLRT